MKIGDKVHRSRAFFDRFGVTHLRDEVGTVIAVQADAGTLTVTWGKATTERLPVELLEVEAEA